MPDESRHYSIFLDSVTIYVIIISFHSKYMLMLNFRINILLTVFHSVVHFDILISWVSAAIIAFLYRKKVMEKIGNPFL